MGCDHGKMWWKDAIIQDVEHVKCGCTKYDARCGGAIMWPIDGVI